MNQNIIFPDDTTADPAVPNPKFCQNGPTPGGLSLKNWAITGAIMAGADMPIPTNQPFHADVE
ncbi:MAG: hypothetical protein R3E79_22480 [Caldilineaceae bacterium]